MAVYRHMSMIPLKKCSRQIKFLGARILFGAMFMVLILSTLQYFPSPQSYRIQVGWDKLRLERLESGYKAGPLVNTVSSGRLGRDLIQGLQACPTTRRPSPDEISTHNRYWHVAHHGRLQSDIHNETDNLHNLEQYIKSINNLKLKAPVIANSSNSELVVYSAYLDDRPLLGVITWIRILGVAKFQDYPIRAKPEIYCQAWYDQSLSPYVTPANVNITGRDTGYRFSSDGNYVQYLFNCKLPGITPIPSHVSLVLGSSCTQPTTFLPVQRPVRTIHDHEIGICVPIAFGSIPAPHFIEWMETYKLLGVKEINLYEADMTNMDSLFQHYTSEGSLILHHMPSPVLVLPPKNSSNPAHITRYKNQSYQSAKLCSAASLNDCMMKNMYRYKYVFVVDMDEFVLPKLHDTLPALLHHIVTHRKPSLPALERISFLNSYFFKQIKPDESQPKHLIMARHRMKPRAQNVTVLPKSLIDPRTCLSIFNHFCLLSLPSLESPTERRHPPGTEVGHNLASIQHYRDCGFSKDVCTYLLNDTVQDDTALRFVKKIRPKVEEVFKKLNIPFSGS